METESLGSNSWQEVNGPFTTADGMLLYDAPFTGDNNFYKLQRPARQ